MTWRPWCARCVVVAVAIAAIAAPAYADGIDVIAWLLRFPQASGPGEFLLLLVALLAIDYLLNALVIGLAAKSWTRLPTPHIAKDLIVLTLLGQVADRIGAFLAFFVQPLIDPLFEHEGEGSWVLPLLVAQFLCAAITVGVFVWFFARRRWKLARRRAAIMSLAGAVLTNPAIGSYAAMFLV